ncbi:MAG: hypothetical protein Rpha_1731 [Candidatus Ruthia sp. Apha_13_S6]|nr:hypothetical protein [Candidatus Ruthia sp. Apha_13_S6]
MHYISTYPDAVKTTFNFIFLLLRVELKYSLILVILSVIK